ncbi:MAG: MFS transporter [Spirulinaceae cyanobacterium SM2_1_0]|nr:MFS transporter [Spirulinaceae cyanobacterium SM2_1_0]
MVRSPTHGSHFTKTGIASLLLAIALILVSLVGLGDAYRNYPSFIADKLNAQGQIVKNSLDTFLAAGLPIDQFSGFSRLTAPLIETDPDIQRIDVETTSGQIIFAEAKPIAEAAELLTYGESRLQPEDKRYAVQESEQFYRIVLPLVNKFEQAGQLRVFMNKAAINQRVGRYFLPIASLTVIALVVFAVVASRAYARLESGQTSQGIELAYTSAYALVAIAVVVVLTLLYSSGLQAKTQAITLSLTSRLEAPVELGIKLADLDGIETTLEEYQTLNPEISYIALKTAEGIAIDTTPAGQATTQSNNANYFVYEAKIGSDHDAADLKTILVKSPRSLLYYRLWRSVKNFLALFVASGFIAMIFLNLLRSLTRPAITGSDAAEEQELRRIEPFYFLGAFIDGLSISFLPQYLRSMAISSNVEPALVSTQFTVFFFGWAIAMIPAASLVKHRDVKSLLLAVAGLSVLTSLGMAFIEDFYLMYGIRALAGATQGLLLVAVQSYILDVASARRKTQAGAMMVFDFFGGRLASTALGALLSVYVGIQGVFAIGIAIAVLSLWYCWQFIPWRAARLHAVALALQPTTQTLETEPPPVTRGFFHDLIDVGRDFQFLKALLLVGLPYRAIFTGVTVFALPLILAQQDYQPEDIGQIIMFYGAGVLITSTYISRLVDRFGRTNLVLCLGSAASGLGLILIGSMAWIDTSQANIPGLTTFLVILGLTITGAGHGSINAPSLTYITETQVADKIGKNTAGSLYRLIERMGQIAGPVLVGQLLIMTDQSPIAISWIGVASAVSGILFIFGFKPHKHLT